MVKQFELVIHVIIYLDALYIKSIFLKFKQTKSNMRQFDYLITMDIEYVDILTGKKLLTWTSYINSFDHPVERGGG